MIRKKPTPKTPLLVNVVFLAAAYYASGKLGLLLAIPPGYATAIWPPAGIALAGLLLGGRRLWPGIVLGSFCVNVATSFDPSNGWAIARSLGLALAIGFGAAAEGLVGAALVRRYVQQPLELVRAQDVARFFLLGGPLSCLVNASIGAGLLLVAGSIGPELFARTWWTWWVGDSIGVSVVAPLLFVWLAKPPDVWRRRRYTVALPLGCVLLLTVALFVWISRIEESRIRSEFEKHVAEASNAVRSSFEGPIQIARSLADLYVATPDAERSATFSTFARRTLTARPGIQALSWNPRVPGSERASFEAAARRSGYDDFRIVERGPEGRLVPAGERGDYVVVLHIEPSETNRAARGFDVASDPVRREALVRACETGKPAATEPVRLVQDASDQFGVLVFAPVYAGAQPPPEGDERCPLNRGFATGVFRIDDVMRTALGHHMESGVEIALIDEHMRERTERVWSSGVAARSAFSPSERAVVDELSKVAHLDIGGRRWSLVFTAGSSYRWKAGTWRPWVALASGMLFAGLLAALLLVVTGNAVVIERLGVSRAVELSTANHVLQREIADRKLVEQALQRNEEKFRQAQKMEAIGRLAGGVAHDFNNLLTVMMGYCELLAEHLQSDRAAKSDLQEIRRAAETAASLTRQLLAFSRKQILAPRVLDLNAVVINLHKMLSRLLEENIKITFHLASQSVLVKADPGQLEQVVMNLAINARDAMPRGGILTIETAAVRLDASSSDSHAGAAPGAYVVLSISDTGTGMTQEVKSHLFEPFFTTKPRGQGTGLGLATVYGIVKQSGGDVAVCSEVGKGTTFKIYLPAVMNAAAVMEPDAPPQEILTGTETVLLVEDEQHLRGLAERILRGYGYTVLLASSAKDGLLVSAQHQGNIDLLLTDVVMPGGSGRELAEQLAAVRPNVKIIYMSGYTEDAIVHHGVLMPGTVLLPKPFTPEVLARKIRQALDDRLPKAVAT